MKVAKKKEDWKKEEWGGWKIVSDMLDHPDENGIYPTSKCYRELYDFVCEQKQKARKEILEKVKDILTSEGGGVGSLYKYLGFKVSKSKEKAIHSKNKGS